MDILSALTGFIELLPKLAIFLVILGVVVTIHELGHYWAGRLFGAAAESFSVGFGKPLAERTDGRGTRWRINALPLGGFVKFVDESQLPGDQDRQDTEIAGREIVGKRFGELTPGQRIVISLAGPFANFLLAIGLFAVLFGTFGKPVNGIQIGQVVEGGPAAEAGLLPGDTVVSLNGKTVRNTQDFLLPIQLGSGSEIDVTVERGGRQTQLTLVPERGWSENGLGQRVQVGRIEASFGQTADDIEKYNPVEAVGVGVQETYNTLALSMHMLGRLVTGKEPLSNLKGPVGIADTTRRAIDANMEVTEAPIERRVQGTFWTLLQLTALISIGIGLVNLMPLPVLDGGHVVFNTYEMISGRPVPENVINASLNLGLILLFGLALVVTWHDILGTGLLGANGGE